MGRVALFVQPKNSTTIHEEDLVVVYSRYSVGTKIFRVATVWRRYHGLWAQDSEFERAWHPADSPLEKIHEEMFEWTDASAEMFK